MQPDHRPPNRSRSRAIDTAQLRGKDDLMGTTRRLALQEQVQQLNLDLGPTLVAALAGASSKEVMARWAAAENAQIGSKEAERLRVARGVLYLVCEAESKDVTKAWFIGTNPRLSGNTPVTALREDHFQEVVAAATAQVTDGGTF